MKTSSFVLRGLAFVLATVTALNLRAQTGYTVTERGPDFKVLEKTTVENGTNRVHRYTELATGLNYTNASGQLTESKEQITIQPGGGAAATQGRHKVYFPADIYNGVIEVVTPDGKHLKSRPLGISYDDGSNTVFIATLKNAQGYLTSSNQVTYRDAFTGFKADLVCTYRRGGFECDLVFRQQPPTPSDYGLDGSFSTLSMVTEFFNTADPVQVPGASDDWFGLQDATLKFGKLTMTHGKAFAFKGTNSIPQMPDARTQTQVYKSWVKSGSRTFLIETVPVLDLADDLNALPLTASLANPKSNIKSLASIRRFPPAHELTACTNQILLATADFNREPGVVLDYNTVNTDASSFTFYSGNTYLISGAVTLGDGSQSGSAVTFQSGTIIKYDENAGTGISFDPFDVSFGGTLDSPIIFTSKDDDSIGERIVGSTGTPVILTNVTYLNWLENSVSNLRFYYAGTAFSAYDPVAIHNCQFYHCLKGVSMYMGETDLYNVLFSECALPIAYSGDSNGEGSWWSITAVNVTADKGSRFFNSENWMENWTFVFQNCLFSRFLYSPLVQIDGDGLAEACAETNNSSFYKSAGAANYYLASNSPHRNVGVGSPDASSQSTTYAPQDGGMPDTDTPDLGYHYPVNEDSDHDGLPDWWEWHWFHNYNHKGAEIDASGNTLISDYSDFANGTVTNDPNVIAFSIGATNDFVNHTNVSVQLDITAGEPGYYAVFVNQAAVTNWLPYAGSNLTVNLGATDATYTVMVGLKGVVTEATQTWRGYAFYLDRAKPVLTITNPALVNAAATVIKPYLQLQGSAAEPLYGLCYVISNASGIFTNDNVQVGDQFFDTNTFEMTTNYFQAYDVPLVTNANFISVRVTDRAGNVGETNFTVTLDYTSATNAPVVKLLWPQDGMSVSGSKCTLRGTMSDETGTLVAQVINDFGTTTSVTNVIAGLIGRNNMFWLEDVPLNGTNRISIQAVDASGKNTTVTNFILMPSPIQLAVTATPTGDDLWKGHGTVGGTVSDPNAVVTVNGVVATVSGNNWSAEGVPIYGQGIATFDAQAAPAGNSTTPPAQANASQEQDAYCWIEMHGCGTSDTTTFKNGGVTSGNEATRKKLFFDLRPSAASGLAGIFHGTVTDKSTDLSSGSWVKTIHDWTELANSADQTDSDGHHDFWPFWQLHTDDDQKITSVPDKTVAGLSSYDVYGHPSPPCIYHYRADGVAWPHHEERADGTVIDNLLTVSAATQMKVQTGGKGIIARQNLFCVTASAAEIHAPPFASWMFVPVTPIDGSELVVGGKHPGADGKVWTVLPDNTKQDITVQAPGKKHFQAESGAGKYKMVIAANGTPLDEKDVVPGAEFCVGQYVAFSPSWSPTPPPYVASSSFHWGLPGHFFNTETTPCPTCSTDPDVDANKLGQEVSAGNWWVSGGNPEEYKASVGMNLHFQNGQKIFLSAHGKFNMWRPQGNIVTYTDSVHVNGQSLQFGSPSIDGITFFKTINIPKNFTGTINLVQVVLSSVRQLQDGNSIWHSFINSPPLADGALFQNPAGSEIDSPRLGLPANYLRANATDDFKTWLMFEPAGGGHAVPLSVVSWFWTGSATNSVYGWGRSSGNNSICPQGSNTENYPSWNDSINNCEFQPKVP